ncbi:MAG: phosphoglucosamine mutase [Elusimicrobia bacterium]|nr:phosphoglucosamine mutase [Elusimicrobiota bacterium]
MKYFGTDGIRAVAGEFPLTKDFVQKLGYAAVKYAEKNLPEKLKKTVLVAEDSRASGALLMSYLSAGINAAGFNVVSAGVAPTPAVSFLVKKLGFAFGAVISASHNPAEFNGIKFFDRTGRKMGEEAEEKIETILDGVKKLPAPNGEFEYDETLMLAYQNFLVNTVPENLLKNKKIVLDCANGATSKIAPLVFEALGAKLTLMANTPDGQNINAGVGALHTEGMRALVLKEKADFGFSFDGDGDRVIASDEKGRELDGDHLICANALCFKKHKKLKENKVVMTVMANLGAINFLKESGIGVDLTGVGDKYVADALDRQGLAIGGETSGHIIFHDLSPTGDGILAALQTAKTAVTQNRPLSYFYDLWHKYPSVLTAVKVTKKTPLEKVEGFSALTEKLEADFKGKGRIFVRYSGTEPKLRILVEGEDTKKVNAAAKKLEEHFKARVK